MSAEKEKKSISQEDIMKLLDSCYEKALNGIPHVSPSVAEMAEDYLQRNTPPAAARAMINNQVIKCATSGFVTGFGGLLTLPVSIPANIGSVLYVQMRMIACTAYMAGYDLNSDQTQTFVYACLAGVAVGKVVKQFGIKFGVKMANGLIKRIPGKLLTRINQAVGFRLVTKFGTKGLVNLGKMVPGVGAVIGGGLDFAETKLIGRRAYKWFIENDFSDDVSTDTVGAVDIDIEEFADEMQEETVQ